MTAKHFLILTFEMPPEFGGGLSTYMSHACRALAGAGHKVTVICPSTTTGAGRQIQSFEGATAIRFNPRNHLAYRCMGHWAAVSYAISDELKWAVEKYGAPDLVETSDGYALGYFPLLRRAMLEPPFATLKFVLTAHTPIGLIDQWNGKNTYALPDYFQSIMEKWCFRAADRVHSPSRFLVDHLQSEFELGPCPMEVVPNPFGQPDKKRSRAQVPEADPYVCVISRVVGWKGVPRLVEQFATLWARGDKIGLQICGQDSLEEETGRSLTQVLRERYRSFVDSGLLTFHGPVRPHGLQPIRAGALAQIHPSVRENFPYTVLEAMAGQSIVIANADGGQAEVIEHATSGYLYDASDFESLSEMLGIVRGLTPQQRGEVGAAAARRVASYCSYDKYAESKVQTADALTALAPPERFPFVRGRQVICDGAVTAASGAARLTVVVPYYNMHAYIAETLQSIYASTIPLDVILVNDGSTAPETEETLAVLRDTYRSLQVLDKPNSGVAGARNAGVEAARTEFVALLDADDLVRPSYYAEAVTLLQQYANVAFVGCWADDFDENGTIRYWPTFCPEPPVQYLFNMTNCQAIVVRRDAYLAAGRHDPDLQMYLDDWEATIGMLAAGYRGVMIPRPLFRYRVRKDGIFRSGTAKWGRNYNRIVSKHAAAFCEHSGEIVKFLNANGPNSFYSNPTYPSGCRPGGAFDADHAHGRLMRLVRGYYRIMDQRNPAALRLARKLLEKPFDAVFRAAVAIGRKF